MANSFNITCAADCDNNILPVLPATVCQLTTKLSEIDMIIFKGSGAGPTSMASSSDWTSKIDNEEALGVKMKYLIGIGSIAEPEETSQVVARHQEVVTTRTRTITFEILEISQDETYDFLRTFQCGTLKPNIYYTSMAGFLYGTVNTGGTDDGIEVESIKVAFVKEKGKEAIDKAIMTIKISSLIDPDRVTNPLAL